MPLRPLCREAQDEIAQGHVKGKLVLVV